MRRAATIVVVGATGRQGGAVARHLRAHGWRVQGLVRNPTSMAARRLERLGVELVVGDLDDRAALMRIFRRSYGVFAVTDFWKNGAAKERQHGLNLVEAAGSAGVRHFVYASAAAVHLAQGVPQLEGKWEVEQRGWALGLPMTVLRPNFFMETLDDRSFFPPLMWGMMRAVIGGDKPLQWVAVDDIGAAAAATFGDPARYIGRTLTLAGDRLSVDACDEIFSCVTGKRPRTLRLPRWFLRRFVSAELVALWEWVAHAPIEGSVELTRELCDARSLGQWLRERRGQAQSYAGSLAASNCDAVAQSRAAAF